MSGEAPITGVPILDEFVDRAVAGVEKAVPGLVESWLERAAATGQGKVDELPEAIRPFAQRALDLLLANKVALGGLSQRAVVAIASKLALGQGDEARRVYLSTQATFEDQSLALDEDAIATQKQAADRSAAWQRVKVLLEEVLVTGAKAAIPLLLAL